MVTILTTLATVEVRCTVYTLDWISTYPHTANTQITQRAQHTHYTHILEIGNLAKQFDEIPLNPVF